MKRMSLCVSLAISILLSLPLSLAQQSGQMAASSVVPRLIRFSGAVMDDSGQSRSGTLGITFALYKDQTGGAALWLETQNVSLDAQGRYTVLLGANSAEGMPVELFTANEPRWLGVQPEGQAEQRVLLVSVPYALKAADAETLGGIPASSFVLAAPAASGGSGSSGLDAGTSGGISPAAPCTTPPCNVFTPGGTANFLAMFTDPTTVQSSVVSQNPCPFDNTQTCLGIGTTNAARKLDVNGEIQVEAGNIFLQRNLTDQAGRRNWAVGTETFNVGDFSIFVSTSNTSYPSQPVFTALSNANMGVGVATPSEKLEVGGNLKISGNGSALIFSDGSVMSSATKGVGGGTITAVNTAPGSGLIGGGAAGAVNLAIDPTIVPQLGAAANTFTGNLTAATINSSAPAGANNIFNGNIITNGGITSAGAGFNNSFSGPVIAPSFSGPAGGPVTAPNFTSTTLGNNNFNGTVIAPMFTQGLAGANNNFAGNLTVAGTLTAGTTNFAGNSNSPASIMTVTQNGSGDGLRADTSSTTTGTGLFGVADAATGFADGVAGLANSPNGYGVSGINAANTGSPAVGVAGITNSSSGIGVFGDAVNAGSHTIGVYGTTTGSAGGIGVVGATGSVGGPTPSPSFGNYGVEGVSSVIGSAGVFGWDTDTIQTGTGFPLGTGVEGLVANSQGTGVFGQANDLHGQVAGVYGLVFSPNGSAVYGRNPAGASGVVSLGAPQAGQFGVQGVADGINGTGVFGHATDTSGNGLTIGVQGIAESSLPAETLGPPWIGTGVQGIGGLGGVVGISPNSPTFDPEAAESLASLNPNASTEISLHPGVVGIGGTGVIGLVAGQEISTTFVGPPNIPTGVYGRGQVGVMAEAQAGGGPSVLLVNANNFDGGLVLDTYTTTSKGTGSVFSVSNTGGVTAYGVMNLRSRLNVNSAGDLSTIALNVAGNAQIVGSAEVTGNLMVDGTLTKISGSFKIDHPLDPEHKVLYHSFVESPDMKNIYDGVATLDAHGQAWVNLPEWFEALNNDFRYQLTSIGAPAPNLYIAHEVRGNRFQIAGGKPGGKVSWQVTGIRQDAYAQKHRIQVEEEKPADEQGFYLSPDSFGQPEEKGVAWARSHAAKPKASPTEGAGEAPVREVVAQKGE